MGGTDAGCEGSRKFRSFRRNATCAFVNIFLYVCIHRFNTIFCTERTNDGQGKRQNYPPCALRFPTSATKKKEDCRHHQVIAMDRPSFRGRALCCVALSNFLLLTNLNRDCFSMSLPKFFFCLVFERVPILCLVKSLFRLLFFF